MQVSDQVSATGPASSAALSRAERLEETGALSGFRAMLKYGQQPLRRFEDARLVSDRMVAFRVLGMPYVTLFELKAIEQVLVTDHAVFSKDSFTQDLRRVLGTGLLTSEGELWRRRRKLTAPSFQRREVMVYGGVMAERAEAFVLSQKAGAVFDVHSALMHLTLDILARALFGTPVSRAADVEHLLERLMLDYLPAAAAWRVALPEWFPLSSRARLGRIRRKLDVILLSLISERVGSAGDAALERAPASGPSSAPTDLLARLMQAKDEGGSLSEVALRDEAMTLFLAGHETTALSLTYTLRLLAQHEHADGRLYRELEEVLAGRTPTMADLPNLPYTRAVVDEAMRLYPPAWAIGRTPLTDVALSGVRVAKGTQIIICPWVLHRDARFFAEPLRFAPERWIDGPAPPRFAYLPFGAGPRVCIGQHFALAEAVLILATLMQRARFELAEPTELELLPAVTLRPRGPVLMRMHARG